MSSLGRHTDWVGTLIRYNSKIRYKPVQIAKIRYIRYNSKIHYIMIVPNRFSIDYVVDVLRSVRDLEVHKRMRSSDATCCASMAVNTCFSVFEQLHRKYGLPEPYNLVHNSFSCPH